MDSSVNAAFIAAGFAVITCIINIIVSAVNSKKDNNLKIIVETRIKYMQSIREANAIFIGIANPDVIQYCSKTNTGLFFYPKELAEAAGVLKTLLKLFYPIENRLIKLICSIEDNCLWLFGNDATNELTEAIKSDLAKYTKLFAQYDWVYWQYIIQQADGNFKNSHKDFDETYEETRLNITKSYGYIWE